MNLDYDTRPGNYPWVCEDEEQSQLNATVVENLTLAKIKIKNGLKAITLVNFVTI